MATVTRARGVATLGFRVLAVSTRSVNGRFSSASGSPSSRLLSGFSGQVEDSLAIRTLGNWTPVRGFKSGRDDPSFRYEMSPPTNWGVRIVPEKSAFVIERFGKYLKTLGSGLLSIDHVLSIYHYQFGR